jgi:hypothetical protein
MTLLALRRYWASHSHPKLIFPAGKDTAKHLAATAAHQKTFYSLLMDCAHNAQKSLAGNHRELDSGIGMTAVLHLLPAGVTHAVSTTIPMCISSCRL